MKWRMQQPFSDKNQDFSHVKMAVIEYWIPLNRMRFFMFPCYGSPTPPHLPAFLCNICNYFALSCAHLTRSARLLAGNNPWLSNHVYIQLAITNIHQSVEIKKIFPILKIPLSGAFRFVYNIISLALLKLKWQENCTSIFHIKILTCTLPRLELKESALCRNSRRTTNMQVNLYTLQLTCILKPHSARSSKILASYSILNQNIFNLISSGNH